MLTVQTLVGFAEKAKANTLAVENMERVPIMRTSPPVEDYDYYYEDMDETANAYQAHSDPVDRGSDDGEEAPDFDGDEENDTFSSYVALEDVTVFEAPELDAIALLADAWNDDLDPEVSAQVVQASAQGYLSYGKEKGKGQGKSKDKGKGRYPVRPSHLSLEDRRRRLKELKSENLESSLRSEETLGKQSRMRNVFLQFVYAISTRTAHMATR